MTPLIDCVFILLVFFMLQTNFLRPHTMEFSRAAGNAGAVADTEVIAVELHDNGGIWLNGEAVEMETLRQHASTIATPENARLVLGIDPDVKLQRAVDVMDAFKKYGISSISMTPARDFD